MFPHNEFRATGLQINCTKTSEPSTYLPQTGRRMLGMSPFIQNCSHDGLSMGKIEKPKKLGIRNDKVMEREMAAAASITLTHNERQHTLMITYNTTTHAYIRRTAIFWLDGCVLVMTRAKRMNEERTWMERNKKNWIRKNARSTTDKTQIEAISPWQNSTTKTNDKQRYKPAYYELRKTQHEDGFFEEKQRKASSKYINSVQTQASAI